MLVKSLGTHLIVAQITLSSPRCTMPKREKCLDPSAPLIISVRVASVTYSHKLVPANCVSGSRTDIYDRRYIWQTRPTAGLGPVQRFNIPPFRAGSPAM